MTDVLARARELVKQSSIPSVNLGEISGQLSSISQAVAKGYTADRDADPSTDSILIHYRDVDRRHESFCQHGGWKLESPSPQDLAEAGFFYAPLQGCEDRVACYACGKVLFNWDPNDEIADAHKLFSPNCPLVTGKPVEIPSAVKKAADKPAMPWEVQQRRGDSDTDFPLADAHLSTFINNIRQGAGATDGEEEVDAVPRPKGAKKKKGRGGGAGASEAAAQAAFPPASMSDGPDNNTGSDTDGPDPAGSGAVAAHMAAMSKTAGAAQTRADRLWKFDWSVPSVVKTGMRGEGAILDAAAGELEMRLNTAKKLMSSQKDDWTGAALRAEAACRDIELEVKGKLDAAQERVDALQSKVSRIAHSSSKLRDDEALAQRASELEAVRSEHQEYKAELSAGEELLAQLKAQTDAERSDLELIKDKDRLLKELTNKTREMELRAKALEAAASAAEQRAAEAKDEKSRMESEMCKVRDELKDEISEQYQSKLSLEASLSEMTEQMVRVKKLYTEYKGRGEEMKAREQVILSHERDLNTREEQVSRREATLKTREEWISKREAQFRIQQRALENAQLLPRGSLITPPGQTPHMAASGSGGSAGGDMTPRGNPGGEYSDGGESGSAAGSGGGGGGREHSLADQVMHAQATYSMRTPPGMESAVAHRGKTGAKQAAQRDYKAILSTSDKSDPQQDRDIAKAARRRDMIKSLIPSKLRKAASTASAAAGAKSSTPANTAASSLDMNAI